MAERRKLRVLAPEHPAWMREAKCRGVLGVLFYPERSNGEVQKAKAVCKGLDGAGQCPVLETCLSYALTEDEKFGVWGGTSERERRRMKRAMRPKDTGT